VILKFSKQKIFRSEMIEEHLRVKLLKLLDYDFKWLLTITLSSEFNIQL